MLGRRPRVCAESYLRTGAANSLRESFSMEGMGLDAPVAKLVARLPLLVARGIARSETVAYLLRAAGGERTERRS